MFTSQKFHLGGKCDTNSHCESGYCGYNGPAISSAPPTYENYACMEKYKKFPNTPCWHSKECLSSSCKNIDGLYKCTFKSYNYENGMKCDNNNNCKSGLCGYNGQEILNSSPNNYENFVCMEKFLKDRDVPCWHHEECYRERCKTSRSVRTGITFYTCI